MSTCHEWNCPMFCSESQTTSHRRAPIEVLCRARDMPRWLLGKRRKSSTVAPTRKRPCCRGNLEPSSLPNLFAEFRGLLTPSFVEKMQQSGGQRRERRSVPFSIVYVVALECAVCAIDSLSHRIKVCLSVANHDTFCRIGRVLSRRYHLFI